MGLFTSSWERQVDDNLFDYIDVDQFKNKKFTTIWNYIVMLGLLLLSIVFYVVDVYTCIKLLAFNEWSSQVKPYLSFKISKWLFAACILVSIVLLLYELIRGIRVFKTRNISLIYTNSVAKTMKSLQAFKYFCVLNEINPTSGFEKMAFYVYFTFHGSKKLILADSPRQVINALTLYSVLNIENGFWDTLKEISVHSRNEAIILYTMTVSFAIWLFFIFQLFFATIFAIPVLHRVLNTLRYKALRQFVCVKVDHTVKKLAKHYQKKSLHKLTLENQKKYKPTLPDVDPLMFTPTIPHKPSTFSSINTSSNSTLRTTTENPFSDSKSQLYEMSNFKQAVARPIKQQYNTSVSSLNDPEPYYRAPPQRKPPTSSAAPSIDHKPSITSINTNTTITSTTNPSMYKSASTQGSRLPFQPSSNSLSTNHDNGSMQSFTTRPEPAHVNDSTYYLQSNTSFHGSTDNLHRAPYYEQRGPSQSSSETSIAELYPKRDVFQDHPNSDPESLTHLIDSDFSDDDDNEDDDYEKYNSTSNLRPETRRAPVRASLLRRAHDMDTEDYTRFNPGSISTEQPRGSGSLSNSRNGSSTEISVFQQFHGRKVLK